MRTASLTIRDDADKLLEFEWVDGTLILKFADESVRASGEKWLLYGLDEIVPNGKDRVPRHTHPTHSQFLERLADYVARQYSFSIELRVHDASEWKRATTTWNEAARPRNPAITSMNVTAGLGAVSIGTSSLIRARGAGRVPPNRTFAS